VYASMGTNSWGSSPLQEVRIEELLAKDNVGAARLRLKEVRSKPRAHEQKRHTRLSPRTSRHHTSEVRLI